MYKNMTELLKPCKIGNYEISHFTVSDKDIRARIDGIPAGTYTRLTHNGNVVMSDTPMEQRTNRKFVREAHGDVLVGGLGIAMIILSVQNKPEVNSITIIEKSSEVIELITSQLEFNDKVKIINADVFTWKPEKDQKFDCIYMDIWNWVNSDVWEEEMKPLKRKYCHYMKSKEESPKRFTECWAEYQAKNNLRLY